MAVTQSALAHAVARDFARAVPPEANLSRLWVWSQHGYIDPTRDYVELWAFVDPVDDATEEQLLEAGSGLDDLYPDVLKTLHLLGPSIVAGLTREEWVKPEAEEIDLHDLDSE
jgi:hypothetical protein